MPSIAWNIALTVPNIGSPSPVEVARKQLDDMGYSASRLGSLIRRSFDLLAVTMAVQGTASAADSYSLLESRLKLFIPAGESASGMMSKLGAIANQTGNDMESVGQLYIRTMMASKELGIESSQAVKFTETLSKAVLVSGASTREASAGLIQLSQALSSGQLRGDEFRSVMENLPIVAQLLADHFKTTIGGLRELSQSGKITAQDIFRAVEEAGPKMKELADKMPITFGRAFNTLSNNFGLLVGKLNDMTGIFSLTAWSINQFAIHLDQFAVVLSPTVFVIATSGMYSLANAIRTSAAMTWLWNSALLANPIVAIITALSTVIIFIAQFGEEIADLAIRFANWLTELETTNERLKNIILIVRDVALAFANAVIEIQKFLVGIWDSISAFMNGTEVVEEAKRTIATIELQAPIDATDATGDAADRAAEGLGIWRNYNSSSILGGMDYISGSADTATGKVNGVTDALNRIPRTITQTVVIREERIVTETNASSGTSDTDKRDNVYSTSSAYDDSGYSTSYSPSGQYTTGSTLEGGHFNFGTEGGLVDQMLKDSMVKEMIANRPSAQNTTFGGFKATFHPPAGYEFTGGGQNSMTGTLYLYWAPTQDTKDSVASAKARYDEAVNLSKSGNLNDVLKAVYAMAEAEASLGSIPGYVSAQRLAILEGADSVDEYNKLNIQYSATKMQTSLASAAMGRIEGGKKWVSEQLYSIDATINGGKSNGAINTLSWYYQHINPSIDVYTLVPGWDSEEGKKRIAQNQKAGEKDAREKGLGIPALNLPGEFTGNIFGAGSLNTGFNAAANAGFEFTKAGSTTINITTNDAFSFIDQSDNFLPKIKNAIFSGNDNGIS